MPPHLHNGRRNPGDDDHPSRQRHPCAATQCCPVSTKPASSSVVRTSTAASHRSRGSRLRHCLSDWPTEQVWPSADHLEGSDLLAGNGAAQGVDQPRETPPLHVAVGLLRPQRVRFSLSQVASVEVLGKDAVLRHRGTSLWSMSIVIAAVTGSYRLRPARGHRFRPLQVCLARRAAPHTVDEHYGSRLLIVSQPTSHVLAQRLRG